MRHVVATLALLAVVLKILIPPGFMPATNRIDTLPVALVLCTGQGPLVIQSGGDVVPRDEDKAPSKPSHEAPCAFAGQALGAPPPAVGATVALEYFVQRGAEPTPPPAAAPPRLSSGPPLPARGPPPPLT